MNKRVLSLALVIFLLSLLAACGGGGSKSISDGYYVPESTGSYEGIKFDDGKVAFYFAGIPGEYAKAYDYTYTKDKKLGWVLEYNSTQLQVEVIDNDTLKFSNGEIYKK